MKKKLLILAVLIALITPAALLAAKGGVGEVFKFFGVVSKVSGELPITGLNTIDDLRATYYNTITGQVWDQNAGAMGDNDTVTRANAYVTCSDERDTPANAWFDAIPSTIRDGWYKVSYYDGTATADNVIPPFGRYTNIKDGKFQSYGDR